MAIPTLSHRQRFNEQSSQGVQGLLQALETIRKGKLEEEEAKRRAANDEFTGKLRPLQLRAAENQGEISALELQNRQGQAAKEKQISSLEDQLLSGTNPNAMGPRQPGVPDPDPFPGPFAPGEFEKRRESKLQEAEKWKHGLLAEIRTKRTGQPTTPEMIAQEREKSALELETTRTRNELARSDSKLNERRVDLEERRIGLSERELGLKEKQLKAELDRLAKGGIDPEKAAQIEGVLRKEFIGQNKSFQAVSESYGRVQAAGKNISAAGDLALIFNYMKMLDPGSVVRESEFATAQNSAGVPDRIRNKYNQILRGERLAPDQREDFLDRTTDLYASAVKGYEMSKNTYNKLAQRYGAEPDRVVIDLSRAEVGQGGSEDDPLGLGVGGTESDPLGLGL